MSSFVVDCSAALPWCIEDEATAPADALLDRLKAGSAVVPSLWHLEIANILMLAEKKGRVGREKVAGFITLLSFLSIEVDDQTHSRALSDILRIARTHGLTSYDAAYLELAMRRGLPLASRDKELCRAARETGVPLLDA